MEILISGAVEDGLSTSLGDIFENYLPQPLGVFSKGWKDLSVFEDIEPREDQENRGERDLAEYKLEINKTERPKQTLRLLLLIVYLMSNDPVLKDEKKAQSNPM